MKKYSLFPALMALVVMISALALAVPSSPALALPSNADVSVYIRPADSATLPLVGQQSIPGMGTAVTYACSLVTKTPADWTRFSPRYDFDAVWTLRNTGTYRWTTTAIDYAYHSGTKMHKWYDRYNLPVDVRPNYTTKIALDIIAPKYAGTYTETWGLVNGSKYFCKFNIIIVVR